jgi:VanZ family protein
MMPEDSTVTDSLMIKSRRQKITLILLIIYWSVLFVLAHIPIPQLVCKAGVSDKGLHFLAYLILTFLLWFAIRPNEKVNWRKSVAWYVILIAGGYGAVDEVIQPLVGRTCDAMDITANMAGILTGLLLFSFFSFWPSALFVSCLTIFGITNIARQNIAELLPVTNIIFHLFAYAIFTALWIQNLPIIIPQKASRTKQLMFALAVPIGWLTIVEIATVILGRNFTLLDIIASTMGILTAVLVLYVRALFRKTAGPTEKSQQTMEIT